PTSHWLAFSKVWYRRARRSASDELETSPAIVHLACAWTMSRRGRALRRLPPRALHRNPPRCTKGRRRPPVVVQSLVTIPGYAAIIFRRSLSDLMLPSG